MSMGIVLKRRDNAPIVKDVFGGALDILLSRGTVKDAQAFVKNILIEVLNNRIPLEKFIVSKSLRDDYVTNVPDEIKNHKSQGKHESLNHKTAAFNTIKEYADKYGLSQPQSSLAHRVLADRMAERDPGTAPKVGDRVQYVYVAENGGQNKQGDRIEHVDYVRANNLHYDAAFYVDHQIQNPVAQLFALCIEQLDGYKRPAVTYEATYAKCLATISAKQPDLSKDELEEETTLAVLKHKEKQIDGMMFLGSPELAAIVRKRGHSLVKGPMDMFIKKTEPRK